MRNEWFFKTTVCSVNPYWEVENVEDPKKRVGNTTATTKRESALLFLLCWLQPLHCCDDCSLCTSLQPKTFAGLRRNLILTVKVEKSNNSCFKSKVGLKKLNSGSQRSFHQTIPSWLVSILVGANSCWSWITGSDCDKWFLASVLPWRFFSLWAFFWQ